MVAPSSPRLETVAKATRVLQAFTPLSSHLTVRQLAERTGIPRSTVHAICTTLCDGGLLEHRHGAGYRLGNALVGLGGQVIDRTGMVAAAEEPIHRLAQRTAAEVHLGQLVGGWVVYVAREGLPRPVRMRNRIGLRAPAHLSGCGKASLSHLGRDEVADLVTAACSAEGRPLPDLGRLLDELEVARREGWLINTGFQQGRTSIAAPVFGGTGRSVGGLSVAGPSEWFNHDFCAQAVEAVTTEARLVSDRLGAPRSRG